MTHLIEKEHIIVTGGAGFVGSHLVEALVGIDKSVMVVDDFSNGRMENLQSVIDDIQVVRCDITQSLDTILDEIGNPPCLDGIFHLACHPRSFSLDDPYRDLEVNAMSTLNMLELAKHYEGCKVVFTSNSGIYGEPEYLPVDENHSDNPTTPYDANKLVSEYYCKIYGDIFDVPTTICRLATVYGPRQRTSPIWKPVIAEFINNDLHGEQSTIYWDGNQTRDFIYIEDVVSGLLKAFYSQETDGNIFILGTNVETSINEIYDTVSSILHTHTVPIRCDKTPGDIRSMRFSSAKAKSYLGFEPKNTIRCGVEKYVLWYKGTIE